ncbi:MAG: hypothetical protein JWN56_315 [Sphingobacteriales bacterium]|nr:hypothetical protein [Sphingobacteriales bacterium]
MKFLAIAFLLLSTTFSQAQTPVTNQNLFDTVGFIPEHYAKRIEIFEKQPIVPGRIIFLGNSITEMGDWKKLTGDTTVINQGISGDITYGVLKRLDDVIIRKPSKIFILIGINDIGKDIPPAVIADNYRKIINQINSESPSTKVYVQSILPVNPQVKNFPQHYDKPEKIAQSNALIKKVALNLNCTFINLIPLFSDKQGRLKNNLTKDGLHLTSDGGGYDLWINYLKQKGYL